MNTIIILIEIGVMFLLFAYDTFFLDWVVFANLRKLRLPAVPVCLVMGALSSLIMTLPYKR